MFRRTSMKQCAQSPLKAPNRQQHTDHFRLACWRQSPPVPSLGPLYTNHQADDHTSVGPLAVPAELAMALVGTAARVAALPALRSLLLMTRKLCRFPTSKASLPLFVVKPLGETRRALYGRPSHRAPYRCSQAPFRPGTRKTTPANPLCSKDCYQRTRTCCLSRGWGQD